MPNSTTETRPETEEVEASARLLGKIGRLPVVTQQLIADYIDALRFMRGTEDLHSEVRRLRRRVERMEILIRSSLVGSVGRSEADLLVDTESRP